MSTRRSASNSAAGTRSASAKSARSAFGTRTQARPSASRAPRPSVSLSIACRSIRSAPSSSSVKASLAASLSASRALSSAASSAVSSASSIQFAADGSTCAARQGAQLVAVHPSLIGEALRHRPVGGPERLDLLELDVGAGVDRDATAAVLGEPGADLDGLHATDHQLGPRLRDGKGTHADGGRRGGGRRSASDSGGFS
jgi:hypothetical protein